VPDIVTETYPFLLTFILDILPSISFCHIIFLLHIKYNFCPPFSAMHKYSPFVSNNGFEISIYKLCSLFPDLLYIFSSFCSNTAIYLSYATTFIFFESSISILGTFCSLIIFLKIYTSKKFLILLLFSYKNMKVITNAIHIKTIASFNIFPLFNFFLGLLVSSFPS